MIVVDFIDMVLESNRDLVLRRLVECLGRDRTKHQVAEVTSLGLVQMTRKRVGQGLVESFSETCQHCNGRGFLVRTDPVETTVSEDSDAPETKRSRRKRPAPAQSSTPVPVLPEAREAVKATLATIAAAAAHAHEHTHEGGDGEAAGQGQPEPVVEAAAEPAVEPSVEPSVEQGVDAGVEAAADAEVGTAVEDTGESPAPVESAPDEQDPSDGI
jgi:ribonuclease E